MDLKVHRDILREAFGDGTAISRAALRWLIAANNAADLRQERAEWHFDNAPDAQTICALWKIGLNAWLERAVALCAPVGPRRDRLRSRLGALWAFGIATHILQDFYAHSNWVELAVARGERDVLAPLLEDDCTPAMLPDGLQSGYFSMRYFTPRHNFSGCPTQGGACAPPPGYAYCHAQLAKDSRERGHGRDEIAPGGPRYHDLAARCATLATRDAWNVLRRRVAARFAASPTDVDGLIRKLAWG